MQSTSVPSFIYFLFIFLIFHDDIAFQKEKEKINLSYLQTRITTRVAEYARVPAALMYLRKFSVVSHIYIYIERHALHCGMVQSETRNVICSADFVSHAGKH